MWRPFMLPTEIALPTLQDLPLEIKFCVSEQFLATQHKFVMANPPADCLLCFFRG